MSAIQGREQRVGRRRAILCVLGSSAAFAAASALVKALGPSGIPTFEIVFFRSFVAFLALLPLLRREGGLSALRTSRPWGHAWRVATGFVGMSTSFYGYTVLPLASVTALGFAMPMFLALLAVPLLGERVGPARALAVAAGFGGVLIMTEPWRTQSAVPLGPAGIVVAGVCAWALAMISIRRMGREGERSATIVLIFSLASAGLALLCSLPSWVWPSGLQLLVLVGIGAVSALAQMLMTEGYRSGDAAMLAPFEYGAILYTTALGYLIWGEAPDWSDVIGMAILVAAGIAIWRQETQG